ncbi:hypothetical protein Moror_11195 [Moniliophthora roreri MCA 2997]|uniref:Uncharacterized protein n=1 Tax=Moniliophthora roreri (strain MCA 2997) TaxID=1381753 RepID=V2W785_MONRO|nr:hypothetical protein Moror_11195 [Moniliophthora roreri MCA 2997]
MHSNRPHNDVFNDASEWETLRTNLQLMHGDLWVFIEEVLQRSHKGQLPVVTRVYTGNRGRPCTLINPNFLRWAYTQRSISGISHFLGVGRTTVQQALLDLGIATPGTDPFSSESDSEAETSLTDACEAQDDLLDPSLMTGAGIPEEVVDEFESSTFPGYLSAITDAELDCLVLRLQAFYARASIRMLDGMLRRLESLKEFESAVDATLFLGQIIYGTTTAIIV